jgi:MoxR-like ATPase
MLLGAKVMALLAGRPHVTYEDVERVALPALRHRLVLSFAAATGAIDSAHVVERVLAAARSLRT